MVSLKKAEEILAMEREMRSIEDEDLFVLWLMCGVPDGDINADTTAEEVTMMYDDSDYKMFKEEYDRIKDMLSMLLCYNF